MKRNRRKDGGDREPNLDRLSPYDESLTEELGAIESKDFADDDAPKEAPRGKRRFDQKRWRDELIERSSERQRMRDRDVRKGLYKHSDRRSSIEDEASTLDAF
jgi:hypothetical protein